MKSLRFYNRWIGAVGPPLLVGTSSWRPQILTTSGGFKSKRGLIDPRSWPSYRFGKLTFFPRVVMSLWGVLGVLEKWTERKGQQRRQENNVD